MYVQYASWHEREALVYVVFFKTIVFAYLLYHLSIKTVVEISGYYTFCQAMQSHVMFTCFICLRFSVANRSNLFVLLPHLCIYTAMFWVNNDSLTFPIMI